MGAAPMDLLAIAQDFAQQLEVLPFAEQHSIVGALVSLIINKLPPELRDGAVNIHMLQVLANHHRIKLPPC